MTDDDNEKPPLRLVSENSDMPDRAVRYAKQEAERALTVAAANLLRVMAGGEPTSYNLRADLIRAILAEDKFHELSGEWLTPWEVQAALALPRSELQADYSRDQYHEYCRDRGMEDIVQGSLRLAAHQLLGERPHFGGKFSKDLIKRGIADIERAFNPSPPPKSPTKKEQAQKRDARAATEAALTRKIEPPARKKPWSSRDSRSYLDPKPDD